MKFLDFDHFPVTVRNFQAKFFALYSEKNFRMSYNKVSTNYNPPLKYKVLMYSQTVCLTFSLKDIQARAYSKNNILS